MMATTTKTTTTTTTTKFVLRTREQQLLLFLLTSSYFIIIPLFSSVGLLLQLQCFNAFSTTTNYHYCHHRHHHHHDHHHHLMTTVNTADYDNSRNHTSNKIDDWIENAIRNGSLFLPKVNQIQIKPSQVLNNNNDNSNDGNSKSTNCGNGLFCMNTNGIKCHELLFSISVRHNVVTVKDSFHDIDCGDAFEGLSRIGLDTVAFAGYLSKCYICDILHTEQQQNQQQNQNQQQTEEEEDLLTTTDDDADDGLSLSLKYYLRSLPWTKDDQNHILWWHNTDSDDDSDSKATEVEEYNDDDDIDNLFCGSIIENEANGIISNVNGAMELLIDILEPILIKKYGDTTTDTTTTTYSDNINNYISDLLPKIIRGAFVILMSRSFDESLFGDVGRGESEITTTTTNTDEQQGYYDTNDDDDDDDDEVFRRKEFSERLVPFFDIMQHSEQPNVYHCYDDDDDDDDDDDYDDDENENDEGFVVGYSSSRGGWINVYAKQDLNFGDELFISYHDTIELYEFGIRFGFVPGEIKDIQTLLKEKNPIFFPTSKF